MVTELHETLTKQLLAKGKSAPQARAAIETFLEWTQVQGTNSWSYEPRAAKIWHVKQRNITPEANFWASKSVEATSEAERSYKELIDIHGEKTIDIVWAAHHACRSSSPCLQAQHSFPVPNSGVIARERPRLRCSIAKRNFLLAGQFNKTEK